jgi:succinyl-diaminopimelate desuccinylase
MTDTTDLASELIRRRSVTPDDAGCLDLIAARLEPIGFTCERMRFGEVDNLWARRGTDGPVLACAGHVDVVPSGPETQWQTPPFDPVIADGWLHGRGAADMKGGLAAMITAVERFVAANPGHAGSLAFLLTSDEEGPAMDGTRRVIETLQARDEPIDWCLLGEPSSRECAGDTLRNGRRGSLNGLVTVRGIQGHVAYPELARNAVHVLAPALVELTGLDWGDGGGDFPPTSFQVANLNAGTGADNIIPGSAELMFNIRFSTDWTVERLQHRVLETLDRHGVDYDIAWRVSGLPFLTKGGKLLLAAVESVQEIIGTTPAVDTGGGTSDGRYIAPTGAEVIELGPVNATIHKIDERVRVEDLEVLSATYERVFTKLLT